MTKGDIKGKSFICNGIVFKVLDLEEYIKNDISAQYRKYLLNLAPGTLVAVKFYGILTPLITINNGVARLTKIYSEANDIEYKGSKEISEFLNIHEPKQPQNIELANSN